MEFTQTLKRKAAALGVPPEVMVMSDLMAIGYSENDAFTLAVPSASTLSADARARRREAMLNDTKFKKAKTAARKRISDGLELSRTQDGVELMSYEEVAKEILISAMHQPVGSKERGEMFMKYAETMRKNDVSDDVTEEPIQFYLPLSCDDCPLWRKEQEREKRRASGND